MRPFRLNTCSIFWAIRWIQWSWGKIKSRWSCKGWLKKSIGSKCPLESIGKKCIKRKCPTRPLINSIWRPRRSRKSSASCLLIPKTIRPRPWLSPKIKLSLLIGIKAYRRTAFTTKASTPQASSTQSDPAGTKIWQAPALRIPHCPVSNTANSPNGANRSASRSCKRSCRKRKKGQKHLPINRRWEWHLPGTKTTQLSWRCGARRRSSLSWRMKWTVCCFDISIFVYIWEWLIMEFGLIIDLVDKFSLILLIHG